MSEDEYPHYKLLKTRSVTCFHDHDFSYDISTGCFQEADLRVIFVSFENLFHKLAKINMFKLLGPNSVRLMILIPSYDISAD